MQLLRIALRENISVSNSRIDTGPGNENDVISAGNGIFPLSQKYTKTEVTVWRCSIFRLKKAG